MGTVFAPFLHRDRHEPRAFLDALRVWSGTVRSQQERSTLPQGLLLEYVHKMTMIIQVNGVQGTFTQEKLITRKKHPNIPNSGNMPTANKALVSLCQWIEMNPV
jgi:hypothetical protein